MDARFCAGLFNPHTMKLTTAPDGQSTTSMLILFDGKQVIGKAQMSDDGYYKFSPVGWKDGDEIEVWILRAIADLIDCLNAEHDKAVQVYFEQHPPEESEF